MIDVTGGVGDVEHCQGIHNKICLRPILPAAILRAGSNYQKSSVVGHAFSGSGPYGQLATQIEKSDTDGCNTSHNTKMCVSMPGSPPQKQPSEAQLAISNQMTCLTSKLWERLLQFGEYRARW